MQSIKTLSGKAVGSIDILSASQQRPTGCVVFAVSSNVAVFLHVKVCSSSCLNFARVADTDYHQDRVDIDVEISKAQAKVKKAKEGVARQQKILNDPSYQQKVSRELQEVEKKKLADFEAEARNFEESVQQFERLKLE